MNPIRCLSQATRTPRDTPASGEVSRFDKDSQTGPCKTRPNPAVAKSLLSNPQGKGWPGAVGMMQAPMTISNGRNDGRARRSGHGIDASTSTKGKRMPMPKNVEDAMPHNGNELASHRSQYKCVEQGVLSNHGDVHQDYDYRASAASSPSFYTSSTEGHKHKPPCTRHTRGVGCADRLENIGGRNVGPPCGTQPGVSGGMRRLPCLQAPQA